MQPETSPEPRTQPPNGVCISREIFQESIEDSVAYNFVIQQYLSRKATDDNLHQRRSTATCRTPHALNSMLQSSVNLAPKNVDCCVSGCVAFTADRKGISSRDVCNTLR